MLLAVVKQHGPFSSSVLSTPGFEKRSRSGLDVWQLYRVQPYVKGSLLEEPEPDVSVEERRYAPTAGRRCFASRKDHAYSYRGDRKETLRCSR